MTDQKDELVEELFDKIQKQKKAIAETENPRYKTNRMWTYIEGDLNKSVNLATVQDVSILLKMAAQLRAASRAYSIEAATILPNVDDVPAFTWNGYSLTDWIHDISARIQQVRVKVQRDKLAALEARLEKVVSPERRRELELEAIRKELS